MGKATDIGSTARTATTVTATDGREARAPKAADSPSEKSSTERNGSWGRAVIRGCVLPTEDV